MIKHYILDEHHRIIIADFDTWTAWMEDSRKRRVAGTTTRFHWVSTMFLGLDHQWDKGPPLLFETMVFERTDETNENEIDWLGGECHRYSTWDDAVAGHAAVVRRIEKLEAEAAAIKIGSDTNHG
jgi:hypothetical protein